MMTSKLPVLLLALALAQACIAQSEISFEWVTVGDPGNPNDPLTRFEPSTQTLPERGAVLYVYSISKYETTIGQYTAFLNAVAKSDPHGLYHPDLANLDTIRGISRVGTDGNYVYCVKNLSTQSGGLTSANLPITHISYLDAVRFANWLHNGQGSGETETGAYTISEGYATRNPDARYWIPTENEWYKAAYYDPSPEAPEGNYWEFPWRNNQTGSRPANYYDGTYAVTGRSTIAERGTTYLTDVRSYSATSSYYGTLNQAGNVAEWTEGDAFSSGPHTRGGHWNGPVHAFDLMRSYDGSVMFTNDNETGFRVATGANPPGGGLNNGDTIRFHPRAGYNGRMVGGVFEGSTTARPIRFFIP